MTPVEDDTGQPGKRPEFEVDRFEYVVATPGTALLRLWGRWRAPGRPMPVQPVLLLRQGWHTAVLEPLPIPDSHPPVAGPDPTLWRSAFSVPLSSLETGTFYIEPGRNGAVALPPPRDALTHAGPAVRMRDERIRAHTAEVAAGLERLSERLGELQRALGRHPAGRAAAIREHVELKARALDETESRLLVLRERLMS